MHSLLATPAPQLVPAPGGRLQRRPPGKLHRDGILFDLMRHFLAQRWSPEQIALTLATIYPKGHEYRLSHETIYNCI